MVAIGRHREDAPRSPQRAHALARRRLPADGALDAFVAAVAAHRGKPIQVLDVDIPRGAPFGLWIFGSEHDLIVVDRSAPPSLRTAIVCHEIAHMLLGHHGDSRPFSAILEVLAPDVSPEVRLRFLGRQGYADDVERDAEQVGTQLAAELLRRQRHARWRGDRLSVRLR